MPVDPRIVWTGAMGFNVSADLTVPAFPGLSPYAALTWVSSSMGPTDIGFTNFTDVNGVNRGVTIDNGLIDNPGTPFGFLHHSGFQGPSLLLGGMIRVGGNYGAVIACLVDPNSPDTLQTHVYEGDRELAPTMDDAPFGPPDDPGDMPQVAFYANFGGQDNIVNNGGPAWELQRLFHQPPGGGTVGTTVVVSTYMAVIGLPYVPPAWLITVPDPEIWAGAALWYAGGAVAETTSARATVHLIS